MNVVLKPDNYTERINSYSVQDWQQLLSLIPRIEATEKFGDNTYAKELLKQGIYLMDTYVENPVVKEFRIAVYSMPIIIDFDWGSWEEGREIVSDKNFDYDTIDIPTKCKVITAIVRNDKFCSGRLVGAFEEGMMLRVLKSIQNQLNRDSK